MESKKAFIYTRVSTNNQEYSPESQEQQCRAYCVAKGYEVVDVFVETGVSGSTKFERRPMAAELLIRIDEADAIVFAKLDRAFRDTVDCLLTVDSLRDQGKTVHFLDLGIDTTTAAGQICLHLMAALAEFERRRISDRIREGLAVAKRRGVRTGRAPVGYRNEIEYDETGARTSKGKRVVDLKAFQAVQRIKDLAEAQYTPSEIARKMNQEGFRTREGKDWRNVQVKRVLARENA